MLICSSKDGVRLWDTMYGWPRVFEDSWNSWELMDLKLFLQMTSNHRRVEAKGAQRKRYVTVLPSSMYYIQIYLSLVPAADTKPYSYK